MARRERKRRKHAPVAAWIIGGILAAAVFGAAACLLIIVRKESMLPKPDELLLTYMGYIPQQKYEEMYGMLTEESAGQISREAFIKRNSSIYEGMEVQNMTVTVLSYDKEKNMVQYQTLFDTAAGSVSFENKAIFLKEEEGYRLAWEDSLIYPGLESQDKIRVSTEQADRGQILDRNGLLLAGEGVASSVGIVPGRLENREEAIGQMAELLGMEPEGIEKKLSAKWVKDDYFVPIKTVRKVEEIELMALEPEEKVLEEYERQQRLLEIPGVMISDTEVRTYPLRDAAAHLVGYVQNVTAEDLEKHAGEGYTANSVIGRSGAESLFEKELKGHNGCRIYMVDADGKEKEELACRAVEHGKDIRLTIDAELQRVLYGQFKEDKGCSVAMDPFTGEVLALVSTPSYDSNDFILGLSGGQWTAWNEDESRPLYNRFRQAWCPGSSFKPVTAAVGLETGTLNPQEDYGNVGLSWQKDTSWGSYYVTTLHAYEPVILENALIYSDNIYFAKAALGIGAEGMKNFLLRLGFQEETPFEISMTASRFSNTENFETEIQLADSGYGQGQMLVNPLHLACIYTAFCNEGNMVKPYLTYRQDAVPEYWMEKVFSADTAGIVLEGMKKAVNDPAATGYGAHREDVLLAGKTGTAEIKTSKDDDSGSELGWFAVFTAEHTAQRPILLVSMTEDVKGRGGSGYVVGKAEQVLESWFGRGE